MRAYPIALPILLATTSSLAAGPVPSKVGQCFTTKIATIGTQLSGIADSGDQVTFANGVLQVSYSKIAHLNQARVGDAVKLCLVSVPDDCPKGDDRGKVYRVTDLRIRKSWSAPNAEHMCGGA